MKERVCGLESETFCVFLDSQGHLVVQEKSSDENLTRFLVFLRTRFGDFKTINLDRAVLPNQAQVYIERAGSFLEICTPECSSLKDLVLHKRVSEAIVLKVLREFNKKAYSRTQFRSGLYFFSRASDHKRRATCACHENYQSEIHIKGPPGFSWVESWEIKRNVLIPFLIARKLLEGSGLIFNSLTDGLSFCISQRVRFIRKLWGSSSTAGELPMILHGTAREEPLTYHGNASRGKKSEMGNFTRHQILSGEHNQSPFCDFIKVGSVLLLLEMIEEGYFFNKEISLPLFCDLNFASGGIRNDNFLFRVNTDVSCQRLYYAQNTADYSEKKVRLCDVLDMYSEWMLDYLTRNYSSDEKDSLYLEKLEVAQKIKYAAECFSRADIFALDQDVDWIIKLRWLQDLIREERGLEIDGEDFVESHRKLDAVLRVCLDSSSLRDKILSWQTSWHQLDPKSPEESPYFILEDCGLVNPLSIGGVEIDLSPVRHMSIPPMNPPNRTIARKKLCDLMRKLGLADFLRLDWTMGAINELNPAQKNSNERTLRARLARLELQEGVSLDRVIEKFPWGANFHFHNPLKEDYPKVDAFMEWMEEFFVLED